jgi:hypothetical protein
MGPLTLRCPRCRVAHRVTTVLDHCTLSWPNKGWLLFECPACGDQDSHVAVEDGRLSTGVLDGAPGPAFMPEDSVEVEGLRHTVKPWAITLQIGKKTWRVKAKR